LTSLELELLVSVSRRSGRSLGRQIEDELRRAIRIGTLKRGSRVPSTRDLALQLGVSRPIVVAAYGQLAAEGYLVLKQGARPRVSDCVGPCREPAAKRPVPASRPHIDFGVGTPDLSAFPRSAWLRSLREALTHMPHEELGYGDPLGVELLRRALAEYLGRVRGLVTDVEHVVVTSGYAQGRVLVCEALRTIGRKRVAIEDPGNPAARDAVLQAGLDLVAIPVDRDGIRVDVLARSGADVVILTPAHQFPTGAVLSGERRAGILSWLRERDAIVVEDDYDAEYRYDRAPVGALQALQPDRIVYAGTASKTLAPALRLGWLVVPPVLLEAVTAARRRADLGGPRIEQYAFADFVNRGELDRHLRRQRASYRVRRDALLLALKEALPEATVFGICAGLHATVGLPESDDEQAILEEAKQRGIAVTIMAKHRIKARGGPPTLLLSYARVDEPTIRTGIKQLAAAIRAVRRRAALG
jgi:GntR family transcriptional regulator/MocR family aminotransferase